jgi:uncharacterized membrane protein YgdD (TMEM256/DUF423 family)
MSSENSTQSMEQVWFVRAFAFMTGCAVGLGAFGAHAMKSMRTEQQLETWKTATLYLLIHGVAGLTLSLYNSARHNQHEHTSGGAPRAALMLIFTGALFFSVSLYLLVLLQIPILGAITPLGGVAMIAGWFTLTFRFRT